MPEATVLLLVLLLVHLMVDFFILPLRRPQAGSSDRIGEAALGMVAHGLAVFVVLWLMKEQAHFAGLAALVVAVGWLLARALVQLLRMDGAASLVLKHLLDFVVLVGVWLTSTKHWERVSVDFAALLSTRNLLIFLAYLIVTRPASMLIGFLLTPWLPTTDTGVSLKNAGTRIGYLERALLVTFVLLDQWAAIGFLLTAKGILRFNDIRSDAHRPSSEYVLLGTLSSFSIGIGTGSIAMLLLEV